MEIRCEDDGKLLARKDEQNTGLYLYCKLCHAERFYTWEELMRNDVICKEENHVIAPISA